MSRRSRNEPAKGKPATARPANIGVIVIHGNGEAEPGWINREIVRRLQDRLADTGAANRVTFADRSEMIELADGPGTTPDATQPVPRHAPTFKVHLRRAITPAGARTTFAELDWSDLSRVGAEPIQQYFAALRLFTRLVRCIR